MTYELKRELVQSQVALADCRKEKEEVVNELRRLHEDFAACQRADYTRVGSAGRCERRTASCGCWRWASRWRR